MCSATTVGAMPLRSSVSHWRILRVPVTITAVPECSDMEELLARSPYQSTLNQEVPSVTNSPVSLSTRQWLTARRKEAQARPDGSVRAAGSVANVPVTVIGMADIGGSSAVWLRASGADALACSQHRAPCRCPGMSNALWQQLLRPQGIRGRVARAVFKSQRSSS